MDQYEEVSVDSSDQSRPCVHCSLINSSSGDEAPRDMFHLIAFLAPGVFFIILGVRWTILQIIQWTQEAKYCQYQEAGLPPPPEYFLNMRRRHFPWEGFVKIVLSLLCIILTASVNSSIKDSNLLLINVYIFFIISGLTDIIIFYNGYKLIPEGLQSLILSGTFSVSALCYYSLITPDLHHQLVLLIIIISINCLTSLLETVVDNRLIKFCRIFFTLLQGSWLVQSSFSSDTSSSSWTSVVFIWHGAAVFTTIILLLIICQCCIQPRISKNQSMKDDSVENGSQLVPCKMLKLSPTSESQRLSPMMMMEKSPSVVDVEPWDKYSSYSSKQ